MVFPILDDTDQWKPSVPNNLGFYAFIKYQKQYSPFITHIIITQSCCSTQLFYMKFYKGIIIGKWPWKGVFPMIS